MRGLILSIFLVFTFNVNSQEIQFKSSELMIDSDYYNVSPIVEIFKINLTDYYFVYTVISEGLILHSIKSKIYEYTVENGVVRFKVDDFDFELHIYSDNCLIFDVDDPCLIWFGNCDIDFSIMLRK